jgi:hypothetical protein
MLKNLVIALVVHVAKMAGIKLRRVMPIRGADAHQDGMFS